MKRYYLLCQLLLACVALSCSLSAYAQFTIVPADALQFVSSSFEKGYLRQSLPVFDKRKFCQVPSGGQTWDKARCENVALLCKSSTNTVNGACPTSAIRDGAISGPAGSVTDIVLRFTEQRSRVSTDVTLHGYRLLTGGTTQPLNKVGGGGDGTSAFYVELPLTSLPQLPFGGIWKAMLKTNMYMWEDRKTYTWDADITLKIADSRNMQIYMPQLTGNTPTVDLHLQARSTAGGDTMVDGHAHIAACLYDGYNSNSTKFTLTASNPDGADFQVKSLSDAPKAGNAGTVAYQVKVNAPGSDGPASLVLQPNNPMEFFIPTTTQVQLVQLPNITGSVLCVPWGIDLDTSAFKQSEKIAGRYSGKLNILFSPSTNQSP